MNTPHNKDLYIAGFPDGIQNILEKIRETIRQAALTARETINYLIPYELISEITCFRVKEQTN